MAVKSKNRILLHSALDGCARGVMAFLLSELTCSVYMDMDKQFSLCLALAGVCAVLSAAFLLLHGKKTACELWKIYGLGEVFYLLMGGIAFLNDMFFHLSLFPRREMGNGDGLLLLFIMGLYVVLSEILRLVFLFAGIALNKTRNQNGG